MKLLGYFSLFVCSVLSFAAKAQVPVYVAAYDYPPYFSDVLETDLTRELVTSLNKHQNSYQFIIEVIPPTARYKALSQEGCCDVIFFESPRWGWNNSGVSYKKTMPLVKGKERLVTVKAEGRKQSFFDNYEGKTLGGVKGYHYLLGGRLLASDEAKENYTIYLANSRIINLRMVLGGRVDLTVVNDELLAVLEGSDQLKIDNLLISEEVSHEYTLHLLVGEKKNITAETLQKLLSELGRKGEFSQLFKRFNMERFQIYRPNAVR
ncbi:amino acid ABC transporter substrate-binding protein [Idiomarina sp. HP20-50]|uniref:amino acid ABC transporter substrate-binding protein n=1 Tax=Idiomarina sp. HP20-50 TaxID=3070813 RepID=UPI00294B1CDE|nr:amino acid ABC transporter substrate-binding protein [Idiomarina sp. HP20-50]MDV6315906.1 amino acid ABC transporter substrate-binding protein [Idiomarina sp. HP20-50]